MRVSVPLAEVAMRRAGARNRLRSIVTNVMTRSKSTLGRCEGNNTFPKTSDVYAQEYRLIIAQELEASRISQPFESGSDMGLPLANQQALGEDS